MFLRERRVSGGTRIEAPGNSPVSGGLGVSRDEVDWVSIRIHLYMRSGGKCEFCRDPLNNSAHVHHRKMRSHGGNHDEVNLALVCTRCHLWTHAHPTMAYEWGWLVSGWGDPAEVPIRTGKPWVGGP